MKILSTLSKEALFHAYVQAIAQKLDPYFVFLLEEEMYRRNLRFRTMEYLNFNTLFDLFFMSK
ncbi:sporulation histidine kinase inhibitor Sda [Bacillus sp. CGMCC 1.60114]|uniref:sporulation histidine kinase inhibitor Sda n=1 Tax=unclassified Bacillus (in: firmicutes) TaxID=185979 RepID=UPI00364207CE